MLEISFQDLVISVLAISMLLLGILLLSRNSSERQTRRRRLRTLITCDTCGHLFKDSSEEKVIKCPECGRPNHRGRDKSLG